LTIFNPGAGPCAKRHLSVVRALHVAGVMTLVLPI
jgi:hypothetical protein